MTCFGDVGHTICLVFLSPCMFDKVLENKVLVRAFLCICFCRLYVALDCTYLDYLCFRLAVLPATDYQAGVILNKCIRINWQFCCDVFLSMADQLKYNKIFVSNWVWFVMLLKKKILKSNTFPEKFGPYGGGETQPWSQGSDSWPQ